MKALHKRQVLDDNKGLDSKEGERRRLCSNSVDTRSPSLGFNPNNEYVSEDAALDYLASIFVEIYLYNEYANKERSDLLPGLDKRASG
jgi:hypothetical protein